MELEVRAEGERVMGRLRAGNSLNNECSSDWTPFQGVAAKGEVTIEYTVAGRCGRSEARFTLDSTGEVMTGSWRSAWPSWGTLRLTKQAGPRR